MPFFIRKNNTISKKMPFVVAKMQSKPACARGRSQGKRLGGRWAQDQDQDQSGKKVRKIHTHTQREKETKRRSALMHKSICCV